MSQLTYLCEYVIFLMALLLMATSVNLFKTSEVWRYFLVLLAKRIIQSFACGYSCRKCHLVLTSGDEGMKSKSIGSFLF